MRCALAVPALTACLVLVLAATCPAQQYRTPGPQFGLNSQEAEARPAAPAAPSAVAGTAQALPETPAAPSIPEPPVGATPPQSMNVPPPFTQRPAAKPEPNRPDTTFAVRPAPKDFRGLAWGTPLSQVEGLVPVTRPVTLAGTYYRPDELLRLGQAEIRSVAYYFPKGTLTGVGIIFEGQDNFFLLKDYLIDFFGPGRQMGDRYGWTWSTFFIDLRLRGATGELRYSHQP
ncbi:MAG: hypothetical protein C0405_12985 [Desulfovibrio sp.]|nr:hypothetical protein [Desulfovibrio sp.]